MLQHILDALRMTGIMAWEMLWALCLGFLISGIIEAVVSKEQLGKLLPDSSPKTILIASGLGAASSSCSYAATALARTLFRKGADFIAAIAFQFASTNLVVELSVLLAVLLGWQFMLAEFTGGPIMIVLIVVFLRMTLKPKMIEAAKKQAQRGLEGKMEGHAAMDMSLHSGTFWQKLTSAKGITAASHYFWMDWYSLWPDIGGGLLISGCLAAWVPQSFWKGLFLVGHPLLTKFWGPLIGPMVAVLSFVCSVGNVPLAAVLWNGGISFGGVIAFLFADLIILPILNIYRKYYGLQDRGAPLRRLLRRHVARRTRCRVSLQRPPPHPPARPRDRHDGAHLLELHHHSQHHLPRHHGPPALALPAHRRPGDDEDDGQGSRRR